MAVDEHTIEVAGEPVFYRDAPGDGPTVLYLHSVPTSSDDWMQFLERGGGLRRTCSASGARARPATSPTRSPAYADFSSGFSTVDVDNADRSSGTAGAPPSACRSRSATRERVQGLVLIDAVPLLDGFQWPRIVRRWRRSASASS